MSEFTPPGRGARMTKAQVRKYIKELEKKRKIAQERLDKAKASGEFKKEEKEIKKLENLLDEL